MCNKAERVIRYPCAERSPSRSSASSAQDKDTQLKSEQDQSGYKFMRKRMREKTKSSKLSLNIFMESLTTFNAFEAAAATVRAHITQKKNVYENLNLVRASLATRDMNPMNSSAGIFPITWFASLSECLYMLHAC